MIGLTMHSQTLFEGKPLAALLLICFILSLIAPLSAQSKTYSQVKIFLSDASDIKRLAQEGVHIDHAQRGKSSSGDIVLEAVLDNKQVQQLESANFQFEIIHSDLASLIEERTQAEQQSPTKLAGLSNLDRFDLGEMAGHYTFAEVEAKLDQLATDFSHLITRKKSIGTTYEGREIWMVKISDNPNIDEDEPEVLYDALHHAREPQGMMTLMYFMIHLLETYASDPQIRQLVNSRELYFIPVVNPDGYVYNQTEHPDGGGFWRKNRRPNPDGSFGVDLNRNYSFAWAHDDLGSSAQPNSDTYRGEAPFSEAESRAIRDFCETRNIATSFSYHAFGNIMIYPWSHHDETLTADSAAFVHHGRHLTEINDYAAGTIDETLGYPANGSHIDWMYGEQGDKEKILAFTPEIGGITDNFWPARRQIIPLAQENLAANIHLATIAGGYLHLKSSRVVNSESGAVLPGQTLDLVLELENIGLEAAHSISVQLESSDPYVDLRGQPFVEVASLFSGEASVQAAPPLQILAGAPPGYRPQIDVRIMIDGNEYRQPIRDLIVGEARLIALGDAEPNSRKWQSTNGWEVSEIHAASGKFSFTDSPNGNYQPTSQSCLTLAQPLDLSREASAYLTFKARWDIETNFDIVRLEASTDSSLWTPLEGIYTSAASGKGVQEIGQAGYDGRQWEWLTEISDLTAFAGQPEVFLRFVLVSDLTVQHDGFCVDDIVLKTFRDNQLRQTNDQPVLTEGFLLSQNYPNPFNPETHIRFELATEEDVLLEVFDITGVHVRTLLDISLAAGPHEASWDGTDRTGSQLASGVYFYRLSAGGQAKTRRMMLIR